MYYEDPVHGIEKNQLRELLIGIANGIMPDTYGLKLIKLHKCGPRVLREMRLCREAGMTGKEIRPYCAGGQKTARGSRRIPGGKENRRRPMMQPAGAAKRFVPNRHKAFDCPVVIFPIEICRVVCRTITPENIVERAGSGEKICKHCK